MLCSKTNGRVRAAAGALALAAALGGCSDLYIDRRDAIGFGAGDAIEANKVAQVYDPWPARSGNVNFPTNGQRMQSAIERYRNNVVTPPVSPTQLQLSNPTPTTAQTNGSQSAPPSAATSIAGSGSSSSASAQ